MTSEYQTALSLGDPRHNTQESLSRRLKAMRRSLSLLRRDRWIIRAGGMGRRAKTTTPPQPQLQQRQVEMGEVLWSPSQERVSSSRMAAFMREASVRSGRDLTSWPDLHKWSISEVDQFWQTVSDFCGIKWLERGSGNAYTPPPPPPPLGPSPVFPPPSATAAASLPRPVGGARGVKGEGLGGVMTDARWFEGATLNFAHNLMPHPTNDEVTFMNLATLPASIREAVHFTCMTHVCNAILEHVTGPSVRTINVLGVHNISLDVAALTDFADESGIGTLRECFSKLLQLVDMVLTNNIDIATDPARMALAYPRLDVRHLASLLGKYRDLSLAAKIRNTVGDEVPQIDPARVTAILKRLKQQG